MSRRPGTKNYLSRLQSFADRRAWPRRKVNLLCHVVFTRRYCRQTQVRKVLMSNLSEGGAYLYSFGGQIPNEFYLCLGDFEFAIPCLVADRTETGIHVVFTTEVPTQVIDCIASITDPRMTIQSLFREGDALHAFNTLIHAYHAVGLRDRLHPQKMSEKASKFADA